MCIFALPNSGMEFLTQQNVVRGRPELKVNNDELRRFVDAAGPSRTTNVLTVSTILTLLRKIYEKLVHHTNCQCPT